MSHLFHRGLVRANAAVALFATIAVETENLNGVWETVLYDPPPYLKRRDGFAVLSAVIVHVVNGQE